MHRLICTFVISMQQILGFSGQGPYILFFIKFGSVIGHKDKANIENPQLDTNIGLRSILFANVSYIYTLYLYFCMES